MKTKLLFVLFALIVAIPTFGQGNQIRRVAILETVDKENRVGYGLEMTIRAKLSTAISNTPGYEGYTRVDVSAVLSEQNFQRTGIVSDADIKRLGELTGADYILIAEAAYIDSSFISIFAQIINVENGRIEQSADIQSSTNNEGLMQSCQKLAGLLFNGRAGAGQGGYGTNSGYVGSGSDFVETAAGVNMKMVWVEGGEFLMGGTSEQGPDAAGDEQPIRRVKLDSYYIGVCEVTQAQWEKVMGTSIYQQASKVSKSADSGVGPDYPMYYVSWEEAQAFCRELSRLTGRTYCLPTEAQWEYAARGGKKAVGTQYKYSGNNYIDAVAWYDSNSGGSTHPVMRKDPNGLGLYDMSGNVWEWCSDWYGSTYNVNDTNNPKGPSSGSYRVLRGGSWDYFARSCRVSYRSHHSPGNRYGSYGFRVVLFP